MNRTSATTNARNRSTKSGFIDALASQPPELLTEFPHLQHALAFRDLLPVLEVVLVCFGGRLEAACDSRSLAPARFSHDDPLWLAPPLIASFVTIVCFVSVAPCATFVVKSSA